MAAARAQKGFTAKVVLDEINAFRPSTENERALKSMQRPIDANDNREIKRPKGSETSAQSAPVHENFRSFLPGVTEGQREWSFGRSLEKPIGSYTSMLVWANIVLTRSPWFCPDVAHDAGEGQASFFAYFPFPLKDRRLWWVGFS
ncbi:hypothetical protein AC1031_017065 [Aphanomyces cochlioides]|nr:hypothetical protein AC1031_017065 [Aphanomyces cochlioides]